MSLASTRLGAGAVLTAAALLALAVPTLAESRPRDTTTSSSSSTTTTSSSSSSSTSTTRPTTTLPGTRSTTTTRPAVTTSTTTTTSTTLAPGAVPPDVQAMIDAYPRTPAGSTRDLVAALGGLPAPAARSGFGRFPVAGAATWSHDWLFPRHTPEFHVHEGTDVFAARGTVVQSPAIGTARISNGAVGGLAVKVVQDDGTYWYLAHLDQATVTDGQRVGLGDPVGTVGDSGNAAGGAPHVHVEVHPFGGVAEDPKRVLDAYYAEALAQAPAVVADYARHAQWGADRLEPLPWVTPVVLGGESCPVPGDAQ